MPDDWDEECPFFNPNKLESLVDEYLDAHGEVCDELKLCPDMPYWAVNRDYNWKEIDQVKAEYLNRIPLFKEGVPLDMFVKFYMENISSVILSEMVIFIF